MDTHRLNPSPYFEKNLGQLPSKVKYKLKLNNYITFFTEDTLVISLPSNIENTRNVFHMRLVNKNSDVVIKGEEKETGIVNYLIGNDESKWINNIPTYSKIKYQQVYENIDLYYYINDKYLEYDFVLSKQANPKDICISFEGIDRIEKNYISDIVLTVGDIKVIVLKPDVYQIINDVKIHVDCEYVLHENKCVSFLVSEYEKEYELILDPVLKFEYSTYIGGPKCDYCNKLAIDSEGCVYITGYSEGKYPTTTGQINFGGGISDAIVTKLSADGSNLVYSTYLGGSRGDFANGIAIDDVGCAYIVGTTQSINFPTTSDAYQTVFMGGTSVFVSKLDAKGGLLLYSTYIGGREKIDAYHVGNGICIDKEGCAYITGITQTMYPVTEDAYQIEFGGQTDAFVTKLDKDGRGLVFSTYLGGNDYDCGNDIVVDNNGCAYITGYAGINYPTTKGAIQTTYGGSSKDAFISKVSEDGSKLIYSTYIGGDCNDQGNAIAIDKEGFIYIVGYTEGSFPTKDAYKNYFSGYRNIFVSKLSLDGSILMYSTYIGKNGNEDAYGVTVDSKGDVNITGYSSGDIFFARLSSTGDALINYTPICDANDNYGRGIAVDDKGHVYIAGYAEIGYPTIEGSYQTICAGSDDVIISKILFLDFDLSLFYKPNKAKLLDIIKAKFIIKNLSTIKIDVNIKLQPTNSSILYVQDSLSIQGTNYLSKTIPEDIYLSNILPEKTAEIELELRYINEQFPNNIPIKVTAEVYDNKNDNSVLIESRTETFYLETGLGPNYIPGCNSELYNLEIDGKIQTTASGAPTIYYKSGDSYIYIEPKAERYVYKVLANEGDVVEHKII